MTQQELDKSIVTLLIKSVESGWNSKRFELLIDSIRFQMCEQRSHTLLEYIEMEEASLDFSHLYNTLTISSWDDDLNISLDEIISHHEESEVSFVEVLCKVSEKIHKNFAGWIDKQEDLAWISDLNFYELITVSWRLKREYCRFKQNYKYSIRPASERLIWFLDIFKHLL
jgi:hypothetical protein